MNNTHMKLSNASAKKLLDLLNDVPLNKRDSMWQQLFNDIKKIHDIWNNINIKRSYIQK